MLLLLLPMGEELAPLSHLEGRSLQAAPWGQVRLEGVPLGSPLRPSPPSPGSQNNCPGDARHTPTWLPEWQLLPTRWRPDCWLWPEPS